MSTQSRRLIALKGVAAQYNKTIIVQKHADGNDDGTEETGMVLLRKIDNISFMAYLSGYILFNCYYWVNMIVF